MKLSSFLAVLVGIVVLALPAHADFTLSKWQYRAPLIAPPTESSSYAELVLTDQVYQHANASLSDLRIVRGDSTEIPYVLVTDSTREKDEVSSVRIYNKGVLKGDSTQFMVDIGREGFLHNQLQLLTNSHNFTREVEVSGSTDGNTWLQLEPKGRIYDFTIPAAAGSPGSSVNETTLRYPETTNRYLQVRIVDKGEVPLSIVGAQVRRQTSSAAKRVQYPASVNSQTQDAGHQASVVTVDLGAKGLPTHELQLGVTETNFQRSVSLEGSDDLKLWRIVEQGDVIFSYQTPKFTGNKLSVQYPESNYRYLRLTVFNHDNAPLAIISAQAQGFVRTLVFEQSASAPYSLYYGNAHARYPDYDLVNYIDYLDANTRVSARLGGEQGNPAFQPEKGPVVPFSEAHPSVLIVALLFVVIVIGGLLFRVLRQK